jgi:hypothetical protein
MSAKSYQNHTETVPAGITPLPNLNPSRSYLATSPKRRGEELGVTPLPSRRRRASAMARLIRTCAVVIVILLFVAVYLVGWTAGANSARFVYASTTQGDLR